MVSIPLIGTSYSAIDSNLKYSMKGQEVSELQEFLVDKGFLTSSPSGFFGLLTLKAVKNYQLSERLPSTGYVGALTRAKVNEELLAVVDESTRAEVEETGTTTPIVTKVAYDVCPNIEGTQSVVPTGMFMDSVKGCFVPEVQAVPVAQSSQPVQKTIEKILPMSGFVTIYLSSTNKDFYIESDTELDFSRFELLKGTMKEGGTSSKDGGCISTYDDKEALTSKKCLNWDITESVPLGDITSEETQLQDNVISPVKHKYVVHVSTDLNSYLDIDDKVKTLSFKILLNAKDGTQIKTRPMVLNIDSKTDIKINNASVFEQRF